MKSFDKFQHGRTGLHEVKIFKKMSSTGVSPNAGNNPGLRKTLETGRQLDPKRALPSSPTKPLNPSAGESTGPQRQQRAKAMGQKAGPKPKGIASVIDRTKKKIQRSSSTETGRKVGRALQGAGKEILDYKPDRERTDTGAGGMGTALRQMTGIGQAAVQGALKAPSERINPKQKKTLGGKLGLKAKERFQSAIGVKPTARTEFGGKMTGDTSKQAEAERVGRIKRGVTRSLDTTGLSKPEIEKQKAQAQSDVSAGPGTGGRTIKKTMANLRNRLTRDSGTGGRKIDKVTSNTTRTPEDQMRDIEGDKDSKKIQQEIEKETGTKTREFTQRSGVTKGNETKKPETTTTTKTNKQLNSAPINPEVVGKETTSVSRKNRPASSQTVDVKATRVNDAVSGSKKPNQISGSRTAGSLPPASSKRKEAQTTRVKSCLLYTSDAADE